MVKGILHPVRQQVSPSHSPYINVPHAVHREAVYAATAGASRIYVHHLCHTAVSPVPIKTPGEISHQAYLQDLALSY